MKLQSKILTCVMGVFLFFNGYPQQEIIHRVAFKGYKKFTAHFLKQQIQTQKGLPFDSLALSEDLKKLNRYPGIKQCSYNMIETPSEAVNIDFKLKKIKPYYPLLQLGTQSKIKLLMALDFRSIICLDGICISIYTTPIIFFHLTVYISMPRYCSAQIGALRLGFQKITRLSLCIMANIKFYMNMYSTHYSPG